MATRVSACDVIALLTANGGEAPANVDPFIVTANVLVNRCYGSSSNVDAATLEQLELYLAAHLASMNARELIEEKLGSATDKYRSPSGDGLSYTVFGQTLLMLDPCGCLKNIGKTPARLYSARC